MQFIVMIEARPSLMARRGNGGNQSPGRSALLLYFVTRNASSTKAKAGEGCLRLG